MLCQDEIELEELGKQNPVEFAKTWAVHKLILDYLKTRDKKILGKLREVIEKDMENG